MSQINMATIGDAFILPFREKQSARKEIEALKKRVLSLEREVTDLKGALTMLVTEKEQPSFLSKIFGMFTFWKRCGPIVEAPIETVRECPEDLMGERPEFLEPIETTEEWVNVTDTGFNPIPKDIFEDKLTALMNQRTREDEEIKASLPTKEEAEKAFRKFNKDRDEEAFKVYADYIEKRDIETRELPIVVSQQLDSSNESINPEEITDDENEEEKETCKCDIEKKNQ